MKDKIYTAIATLMLFVPWTILPLRTFDWALQSPADRSLFTAMPLL